MGWTRRRWRNDKHPTLAVPRYTTVYLRCPVPRPSYSNNGKEVKGTMAICDNCKKTPLEYGEINQAYRDGTEVTLCDECYRMAFEKDCFGD